MLDIETPALQQLYRDWQDRRRGRDMPARRDFDVLDLGYIIGNLSLLDVFFHPLRFRFRLHASRITDRVGYEMTGKDLDAVPARDTREAVRRHLVEVINLRAPVVQRRERQILDDRIHSCEVLALPLASDGSTIDMLMTGLFWL